jgi:DNA-binding SARP family transcriptional activator
MGRRDSTHDAATAGRPTLRLAGAREGAATLELANGCVCALDGLSALIVARLALAGPQPRSTLAAQLWPEVEPARARANLRQRLLRLKAQAAGLEWIVGDAVLSLAPEVQLADADPPLDASDPPPLLHGLPEPANEELATWLAAERERQRGARLAALHEAAAQAEAEGRHDDAVAWARRAVALAPLAEAERRALIRQHYLAGDTAAAEAAWRELAQMLEREFGAAPDGQTRGLMALVRAGRPLVGAPPADRLRVPVALQRPPRLVGREAERQALHRAVQQRSVLLLVGEAGMGKSRLLAEVLADLAARRRDSEDPVVVVASKARSGDAGVPYSTLARLLRKRLQQPAAASRVCGPALARLLPELADGAALPLPVDGDRLLLQQAVLALFTGGAGHWLIALDDLHFADEASLELLHTLLAADEPGGPAALLTQRPGEGPAASRVLADSLAEAGRLSAQALAPLDAGQMRELVSSLGLPELDADTWGPRLAQHCGGNPLFALETLKAVVAAAPVADAAGSSTPPMPRPLPVLALIERRLRQLSERGLALARVAAIAGPDLSPALAEAVIGRPAVELADAWAELEAAQVLRDQTFAHDLVLEATLASLPKPIAAHLHGQVASWLEPRTPEPARVAAHWIEAGEGARAPPWLLQAADRALAGLRRREEAQFLAQAATIETELGKWDEALGLWLREAEAREVVEGTRAAMPSLDRAYEVARTQAQRVRVLASRLGSWTNVFDWQRVIDHGESAIDEALAAGDDEATAEILSRVAASLASLGRGADADAVLSRHWYVVERLSKPNPSHFNSRAMVLDNLGLHAKARPFHDRAISAADRIGDAPVSVVSRINQASGLLNLGHASEAIVALDEAERLRLQHDGMEAQIYLGWRHRGSARRDLGHFGRALADLDRAIDASSASGSGALKLEFVHRAWVWLHIGQRARVFQDLDAAGECQGLPSWVHARALHARARLALAESRRRALEWLDKALDLDGLHNRPACKGSLTLERALIRALAADPVRQECLLQAAAVGSDAGSQGLDGLELAAEWTVAQLATGPQDRDRRFAAALRCTELPPSVVPSDLTVGRWQHGLWRVWQQLGDPDHAAAARAEGVAWIHRTLRSELPSEFHAGFKAVPEHRELLG